jgi:glycerophosphoryl diester phosphodiesterase
MNATLTKALTGLVVIGLVTVSGCESGKSSGDQELHTLPIETPDDVYNYFRYRGENPRLISGHRGGEKKGYPENCIETFEHVLRYTPATFEIDPRLTKDSVIVLMHDATLDRTTNGTGKLSDYTWEEVKQLRLKDSEGTFTDYRIPTLEEVIKWAKGKTVVILDKKDVPFRMTADIIRKHNAEAYVMITVHNAEQAKFYYEDNPKVMFEAFVRTKEALYSYEEAGIPWSHIMAYVGPENTPLAQELCEMLHERGAMCMISAAPIYDKLDSLERVKAYREIYNVGVDIIESDRPIEVAEAIR